MGWGGWGWCVKYSLTEPPLCGGRKDGERQGIGMSSTKDCQGEAARVVFIVATAARAVSSSQTILLHI